MQYCKHKLDTVFISQRKVLFQDILEYKKKDDAEREKILDQLTEQAQDLDMGY